LKTCQAAKVKTLVGCFGERCGAPATEKDELRRDVCAACAEYSRNAKKDPSAFGNVLGRVLHERNQRRN
jgi:hypothetical protein